MTKKNLVKCPSMNSWLLQAASIGTITLSTWSKIKRKTIQLGLAFQWILKAMKLFLVPRMQLVLDKCSTFKNTREFVTMTIKMRSMSISHRCTVNIALSWCPKQTSVSSHACPQHRLTTITSAASLKTTSWWSNMEENSLYSTQKEALKVKLNLNALHTSKSKS